MVIFIWKHPGGFIPETRPYNLTHVGKKNMEKGIGRYWRIIKIIYIYDIYIYIYAFIYLYYYRFFYITSCHIKLNEIISYYTGLCYI